MNDGITVDANVMCGFTKSLILNTRSDHRSVVERIRTNHGFVIDEKGLMQHQWLETCGNSVFGEWFYQQLREGVVKEVVAKLEQSHRKKLHDSCGMPRKREIFYVAVAAVTDKRYIVTEDIDFWEPEAKSKDYEKKSRIKANREGRVCRYLKKQLNITVGTSSMALADL